VPETPEISRARLTALIVPIIHRPCPRCHRPEPVTVDDRLDCVTCLDSGSIGPVYDMAEAVKYAERIAAAVLPAHRAMVIAEIAAEPPEGVIVRRDDLETYLNRGKDLAAETAALNRLRAALESPHEH
jgi:hypothetical protein